MLFETLGERPTDWKLFEGALEDQQQVHANGPLRHQDAAPVADVVSATARRP